MNLILYKSYLIFIYLSGKVQIECYCIGGGYVLKIPFFLVYLLYGTIVSIIVTCSCITINVAFSSYNIRQLISNW